MSKSKGEELLANRYSAPDLIALIERIVKQYENEITSETYHFYPHSFTYPEIGNGTVSGDLGQVLLYLNQSNPDAAIKYLDKLIAYQIQNGFWDKSKRKLHRANEVKVNEVKSKIESLEKVVRLYIADLIKAKKENENFLLGKQEEYSTFVSKVESIQKKDVDAQQMVADISNLKGQLAGLIETELEKAKALSKEVAAAKKEDANTRKTISSLERKINTFWEKQDAKREKFDEDVAFFGSKKSYFEERIKVLDDLIGREVGASLFKTFKSRKDELKSSVNLWMFVVAMMAVVTAIWIISVLKGNLFGLSLGADMYGNQWLSFASAGLKILPALILLYFSIRQYRKERDYQEEYAFKSAVALTVEAYAGQIKNAESRDQLIAESVRGVYISPVKNRDSKSQAKAKGVKEGIETGQEVAADTLKKLAEVAKLFKSE